MPCHRGFSQKRKKYPHMRPRFTKDLEKMKASRDKMVAGIEQMLESPDIDMGHLIKKKK